MPHMDEQLSFIYATVKIEVSAMCFVFSLQNLVFFVYRTEYFVYMYSSGFAFMLHFRARAKKLKKKKPTLYLFSHFSSFLIIFFTFSSVARQSPRMFYYLYSHRKNLKQRITVIISETAL